MPRPKKSTPGRKPRDGKAPAICHLLIRLTDAEARRLRVLAGDEPLSAWARTKLLAVAR